MEPILFRYRGRDLCAVDIALVRATIAAHHAGGRSFIAQVLCEHWAWRQPNGAYKGFAARDLLLRLEEAGYVTLGVLSLTESPDDLLMWAHYVDCHRGLALQLDETHEFFAPRVFEGQELSLTKVEYTDERPVLSYSTINSPRVFYRKSPGSSPS